MNKVLLASHGPLAKAMKETAAFLLGENENVFYISAYIDEVSKDLPKMIDRWMDEQKGEDTWIIITDVFGGSVNNEFMVRLVQREFYLIAGMSLPLVLSVLSQLEDLDEKLIKTVVEETKEALIYCNDCMCNVNNDKDEEF